MRKDILGAIRELARRDKITLYQLTMLGIKEETLKARPQAHKEQPNETAGWLELFRKLWERRFNQLDQLMKQIKSK